ncbi:unnamed protein product [Spirodela intermedia]|uniref:ABC transporter domain-containing protein n=1 Tax=Spirodela intermedia TaxID=51605 RepID=A0A7I8J5Z8_SPIIN|nr:unnamed protein product [Spirodela intermedia]CAA6665430.1 unnamed protein product [Spirodela intermedia]
MLAAPVEEGEEAQSTSEDPEAPAGPGSAGGVPPVTIRWSNITCTLSDKRAKVVRFLLTEVSGEAKPGRLLAIMGPSGSGKTTLINVLAGQLTASPRLHLTGYLDVNGQPRSGGEYKIAFLRQEDLFFSQLTVRETLSLAAELQLPDGLSAEARDEYVNKLLFRLGLINCADSIVGDTKVRGISGGEKKRLSLACELIASPSLIFADEPTTGLDAFQAEKVMETLQQLALDGHTVICSIHQPRGSIYSKSVVYMGPAKEEPLSYFAKFGYQCPDHVNPAEFLADLISVDYTSAEAFSQIVPNVPCTIPITRREGSKTSVKFTKKPIVKRRGGWWKQFWLLLKRAWMQASRDGPTNKVRTRMSIASAMIFGSVFWRMGRTQTSIQDRMGLLQVRRIFWPFVLLQSNTAMAALTKTVGVFPKEKAIVDRERAKGSYTLGPYLLSKLLAEIPVVLPMVPTTEAAMALGPSLMTVFIVFGGYYVNAENTPLIFRWIPRVSLIRWAFQGLSINEFHGLEFEHQHSFDIQTGEQALERLSFGGSRIRDTVMAQGRILMFWYWTTYLLLEKNKPKYQQLLPPPTPLH